MDFVETVRCAIEFEGKILLLKKSKDSKFPEGYELPGGKSEQLVRMNTEELRELVAKEIKEETGINLAPESKLIQHFSHHYSFISAGEEYKRKVIYFQLILFYPPEIILNNIPNEDHHESFVWIPKDNLDTFIQENKVSPNSIEFLRRLIAKL